MWVTAYTDASFKGNRGTWAIWLRSDKGRVVVGGDCPDWVDTSTTAELWAVWEAVSRSRAEWTETVGVLVNTDCVSLVKLMWPWSPKPSRASMVRVQKMILELKLKIRAKHVKGHQQPHDVRSYLNVQVDRIAGRV